MTYFDTALIGKCYLHEPEAGLVRAFASQQPGLASCELARVEFASLLHRNLREGRMSANEYELTLEESASDERAGVWHWLPLDSSLLEAARCAFQRLPPGVFLRAGDALHLACARRHGFTRIYSNDRHLLAAAPHFQLEGINLLA